MRTLFFICAILFVTNLANGQSINSNPFSGWNMGNERYHAPRPLSPAEMHEYIKNAEPWLMTKYQAEIEQVDLSRVEFFKGVSLLENENYLAAIDTLKMAKLKFDILKQPIFQSLTNICLAYAHLQLGNNQQSIEHLDWISYRNILPEMLLLAGDLYYMNGVNRRAIKIYKYVATNNVDNFDAYGRIIYMYQYELNSSKKAEKYQQKFNIIQQNMLENERISDELNLEIKEMESEY